MLFFQLRDINGHKALRAHMRTSLNKLCCMERKRQRTQSILWTRQFSRLLRLLQLFPASSHILKCQKKADDCICKSWVWDFPPPLIGFVLEFYFIFNFWDSSFISSFEAITSLDYWISHRIYFPQPTRPAFDSKNRWMDIYLFILEVYIPHLFQEHYIPHTFQTLRGCPKAFYKLLRTESIFKGF